MLIITGILTWVLISIGVSFIVTKVMTSRMKDIEYSKLNCYIAEITRVNIELFTRYIETIESARMHPDLSPEEVDEMDRVADLCRTALEHIETMPPDKQSRWLGYAQKALLDKHLIYLKDERLFTRCLFHEIYDKFNMSKTIIDVRNRRDK